MGSLARLLGRVEAVFEYIAIGLLATMMLLVSMDAAGRYLFLSPILGTHEFVETYLMVGVVWLGMAQIQAAGGQVSVDILSRTFPPGVRRALRIVFLTLALFFVAFIAWRGAVQMGEDFRRQSIIATPFPFTSVPMPIYLSWALLAAGAALLWLRLAVQLARAVLGLPEAAADAHHV